MRKILLIDICGTITVKNTTLDFIAFLGKKPNFLSIFLGRLAWRFFKNDYLRKKYIKTTYGMSCNELSLYAIKYVEQLELDQVILKFINKYREDYELYFVTASLDIIASQLANRLKICGYYASELNYIEGVSVGCLKIDLLDKKDSVLSSILSGENQVTMISDNFGDYDIMKSCNDAWAVARDKNALKFWRAKSINIINRS
ncbi:haloacid dehalogenase-like hydrolase [Citrobacter portucalensis]|uniref:haloacid dehalogenase-like hydrolase n=1 Tax=Citrobacter portucalensis TaxID=1639133 RepID=UPI001E73E550|nr:hypothetical protein E5AUHO_42440 [Citrobacter freundii]